MTDGHNASLQPPSDKDVYVHSNVSVMVIYYYCLSGTDNTGQDIQYNCCSTDSACFSATTAFHDKQKIPVASGCLVHLASPQHTLLTIKEGDRKYSRRGS